MLRLPPGSRAEGSKILVYKTAHDGALPLCHIAGGGGAPLLADTQRHRQRMLRNDGVGAGVQQCFL